MFYNQILPGVMQQKSPSIYIYIYAFFRTLRWLDRCLKANKRPTEQCLFPIVQGGLDPELRKKCAEGNKIS